jgi:hypothetical protein
MHTYVDSFLSEFLSVLKSALRWIAEVLQERQSVDEILKM